MEVMSAADGFMDLRFEPASNIQLHMLLGPRSELYLHCLSTI